MSGLRERLLQGTALWKGVREAREILSRDGQKKPEITKRSLPEATPPTSAPGSQASHHSLSNVHGAFGYLKELFNRFNGDFCPAWAAALSFFALLSFVPILICGIAVLGFFIQDPHTAALKVQNFLVTLLPGGHATATAKSIIQQAQIEQRAADLMKISGWASLFGLVSLFWAASRIFVNATTPMNAAFRTTESRSFITLQLYAIGLMFGAGFLFLLSLLPSSGPALLRRMPFLAGIPDPSPWWLTFLFFLIGVAINVAMFTVIYRFLPSPSARVKTRQAVFAGSIVALLWEAAKEGFALYLRQFGGNQSYDKVYGSLGGLIILILWIYYSSMLLLLGAEIAKLYQDYKELHSSA